jgi:imidazolonepropionase
MHAGMGVGMWDALWTGIEAATLAEAGAPASPAGLAPGAGLVPRAALGVHAGRIAWIGPEAQLPGPPARLARTVHAGGGRLATPGLVDCHTHLLFGGDRAGEFARRTEGMGYAAISAAGGGIRSTVAATRPLSEAQLVAAALPRARALMAEGVTTVEVKSGYALDVEGELRLLRAARALGRKLDLDVVPTLLALHALPPEYADDRAGWVSRVVNELVPAVAEEHLATSVDVFCEGIAFSIDECALVLEAARAHGLATRVHADQLSPMGAAGLAARFGSLSADHVEYSGDADVAAMAAAGTVAVLLPAPFVVTGETRKPPVAALRAAGVPMALATDCNPGTSPCTSPGVVMALARAHFGLTAIEALAGMTVHAARALALGSTRGQLVVGQRADFCLWDLPSVDHFGYWLAPVYPAAVVRGGRVRSRGAQA